MIAPKAKSGISEISGIAFCMLELGSPVQCLQQQVEVQYGCMLYQHARQGMPHPFDYPRAPVGQAKLMAWIRPSKCCKNFDWNKLYLDQMQEIMIPSFGNVKLASR